MNWRGQRRHRGYRRHTGSTRVPQLDSARDDSAYRRGTDANRNFRSPWTPSFYQHIVKITCHFLHCIHQQVSGYCFTLKNVEKIIIILTVRTYLLNCSIIIFIDTLSTNVIRLDCDFLCIYNLGNFKI